MRGDETWIIEIPNEKGGYIPLGFDKPWEYATKKIAAEEAMELPKKYGKWRVTKVEKGANK